MKQALNVLRTAGPAMNICQQNAIGRLIRNVDSQTDGRLPSSCLKYNVAAKLISGHISRTVHVEIVSILRNGDGFSGRNQDAK